MGSLLPLLGSDDAPLRLSAAASICVYASCDEGCAALGAGRTKAAEVLAACLRCVEEAATPLRAWALNPARKAPAPFSLPPKEAASGRLAEVVSKAIWVATAASVKPGAKPLGAADLEKLCELVRVFFHFHKKPRHAMAPPAAGAPCSALRRLRPLSPSLHRSARWPPSRRPSRLRLPTCAARCPPLRRTRPPRTC